MVDNLVKRILLLFKHYVALMWLVKSIMTVMLIVATTGLVTADVRDNKISLIKSAFVYNIGRLITWPSYMYEAHPDYVTLCFYRQDVLGRGFKSVYKKKIQQRKLVRQTIEYLAESKSCDILYIPSMALPAYLDDYHHNLQYGFLTLADMTDTDSMNKAYDGIMMNLIRQGSSIGFEVNLTEVNLHGLEISSEILKMAAILSKDK